MTNWMGLMRRHTVGGGLLVAVVLASATLSGCGSVEPQPYYDHREEGPRRGLVSGEEGGFVIYRRGEDQDQDKDQEERPESK